MRHLVGLLTVALSILASAPVAAAVRAVTKIDSDEILRNGPVSGRIYLTSDAEMTLEGPLETCLSFSGDIVTISIEGSTGAMVEINKAAQSPGMCVNWGGGVGKYVWHEGETIVVPFMLLRTDDEFLFSNDGIYKIRFAFNALPEPVIAEVSVKVVSCSFCGEEDFIRVFRGGVPILQPFSDGGAMVSSEEMRRYGQSTDVVRAYCAGGKMISYLLGYRIEELAPSKHVLLSDKYDTMVDIGFRAARRIRVNLDIWDHVMAKREALRANSRIESVYARDSEGRRIIVGVR